MVVVGGMCGSGSSERAAVQRICIPFPWHDCALSSQTASEDSDRGDHVTWRLCSKQLEVSRDAKCGIKLWPIELREQ